MITQVDSQQSDQFPLPLFIYDNYDELPKNVVTNP